MKYLSKKSCERAIKRLVDKLELDKGGYVLEPVRVNRLWRIRISFPVEVRARGLAREIDKIQRVIDKAELVGQDEDVRTYWTDTLRAAYVALWEIEAAFVTGAAKEVRDE